MNGFGETGENDSFGPKWPFLVNFGPKWQNEIFCQKAKMSLPYAYYAEMLCKNPEQTYERIKRSTG